MFASPSYLKLQSGKVETKIPFAQLKYQDEYRCIKDSVKKAKVEVVVHKVHGTFFNLRETLEKQRPGAIHFSGHGLTKE
jgi:hypothetical protein